MNYQLSPERDWIIPEVPRDVSLTDQIIAAVATAKERERLLIQRLKDETHSQEIYDLCSKHLEEMAS